MARTQQEEFLLYDLQEQLFGTGKVGTPIWLLQSRTGNLPHVEAYAKLQTRKDRYRVFINKDTNEMARPQNEWFTGFCRAWNRFERNYPFVIFPFSTEVDIPLRSRTKKALFYLLRYTEWYFLRFGKRVPVLIPVATYSGKGYFKPGDDEPGHCHQALMMVLPLEPFKRYQIVNIDTAGWTDDYTAKWRDEVLTPLTRIIAKAFARSPQSEGIQTIRSRHVEGPHLHRNLQEEDGSCSTFSFLVGLEIVRTPHARWQDAIERLHHWSWTVGVSAARRRMGTYLVNATKVFVYLARLLVQTKKRVERKQGAPYRWSWVDVLEEPIARQLWRQDYGPKIKQALEKASFLHSEALLGPTAPQLRRMRKLHLKVRHQLKRGGKPK